MSDREPPGGEPPGEMPAPPPPRDPWLRFALTFAALAVVSELVYYGVALESEAFQTYLAVLARISGWILSFAVEGVRVQGTFISSQLFAVEIARGCDAYRICALLTAAILAFPAPLRLKAWGILLGLLWLNFLNFVRIIGLIVIGGTFHSHFQRSHEVYFPVFLIAMTVVAWVVWVRRASRELLEPQPTAA